MSVVLQRRAVLDPPAGEWRLTTDGRVADREANRIARQLDLRFRDQWRWIELGATDGGRIGPCVAENIRAGHHVDSRSDARRCAGEMNAIHKKLGIVRKITASGRCRRCATV